MDSLSARRLECVLFSMVDLREFVFMAKGVGGEVHGEGRGGGINAELSKVFKRRKVIPCSD